MPFNKYPSVEVQTEEKCQVGWHDVLDTLASRLNDNGILVVECYHGVYIDQVIKEFEKHFPLAQIVPSSKALKSVSEIESLTLPDITEDRIFGRMSKLVLADFFDDERIKEEKARIASLSGQVIVIGTGASLLAEKADLYVYLDMARWEIQLRMRQKKIANIGLSNYKDGFETHYKRGYFLDWRVCDQLKQDLCDKWDYFLDTNDQETPKMISKAMFNDGLDKTVNQPFSLVPFFDPGPWGGQWMREKFDLDKEPDNFAWCFNCVPEENSLLLDFNGVVFETPSINLVFFRTTELLGKPVEEMFGAEFPIRFDFLDTIDGGNLSLQVHPLKEYIHEHFGMTYTQDESYYMLDAKDGAQVYLGLREDTSKASMIQDLHRAQQNGNHFDADQYAQKWPAKKHDHFLIPAGTVHCSGTDCMVLEISATPYIFTFKLWDWGRLGMDGKPRPINIAHGEQVIQWDRQPKWTKENLINRFENMDKGDGWREERTGLHELEFIETRRHWQTSKVLHETGDGVNVLMLVEGDQALVECPDHSFEPFLVNYAEAFVIPAKIKKYSIRPVGLSEGKEIATIKAFVRT